MKSTGKPKELLHIATGGILNFFAAGINAGKGVIRTSADSMAGRRMTSAKGSIFAEEESRSKQYVLEQVAKLPKPGCGAKEIARRLRRLNNASSL